MWGKNREREEVATHYFILKKKKINLLLGIITRERGGRDPRGLARTRKKSLELCADRGLFRPEEKASIFALREERSGAGKRKKGGEGSENFRKPSIGEEESKPSLQIARPRLAMKKGGGRSLEKRLLNISIRKGGSN